MFADTKQYVGNLRELYVSDVPSFFKGKGRYYFDPVTGKSYKIPVLAKGGVVGRVDTGKPIIRLGEPKTIDVFARKFWHTPGMGEVWGFQKVSPMTNIFTDVKPVIPAPVAGRPLTTVTVSTTGVGTGMGAVPSAPTVGRIGTGFRMPGGFALAYGAVSLRTLEFLEEGTQMIHSIWKPPRQIDIPSTGLTFDVKPVLKQDISVKPVVKVDTGLIMGKKELEGPGLDIGRVSRFGYDVTPATITSVLPALKPAQAQAQAQLQLQLQESVYKTPRYKPPTTPKPIIEPYTPKIPKRFWFDLDETGKKRKRKHRDIDILGKGYRRRKWKTPSMEVIIPDIDTEKFVESSNVKKIMKKFQF